MQDPGTQVVMKAWTSSKDVSIMNPPEASPLSNNPEDARE
jgi:hypothetical protein